MKTIRLDRLLGNLGYGTRSMLGKQIRRGVFTLDGEVITDAGAKIPLAALSPPGRALLEGEPLDPVSPLTIVMHKPAGYICSHDEPGGGASIFELLPHRFQTREPVLSLAGRLDKDSTGLVILTDDGPFVHRIISPKIDVPKKYRVTLENPLQGTEGPLFAAGTMILSNDTKPLKPAGMEIIDPQTVIMTLHEGRYHQIRRMFAATENHVTALHRFAVGGLDLTGLALEEGAWRILTPEDREKISR